MDKFFIPPPLSGVSLFFWFDASPTAPLFSEGLPQNFFKTANIEESPEACDAIILPHNFTLHTEAIHTYIAEYAALGEKYNKPVFIFSCGDQTDSIVFDKRVWVFRYSLYRSVMSPRDISMPTLTADIGSNKITLRGKNNIPVVSFCGRAEFSSSRETLASWVRRLGLELRALSHPQERARIRGVFWRQWSIGACSHSQLVQTLFVIRKTFSGALRTIEVSPEQARTEFVESIEDSDFVLASKGDGNYSNRFLEALAMGRIPVFVDTDMVLPLAERIDYAKISVRVPMDRVYDTPKYIREFYDALSVEEWSARQKLARQAFELYLRQDSFFRQFFT